MVPTEIAVHACSLGRIFEEPFGVLDNVLNGPYISAARVVLQCMNGWGFLVGNHQHQRVKSSWSVACREPVTPLP